VRELSPPRGDKTMLLRVFPQGSGACVDTHHVDEESALEHGDTLFPSS
jgi:hypothetical protein